MGLKIKHTNKETRKSKRDLILTFDGNTGKLFIEVKNSSPQFINAAVVFNINKTTESIDLDENGKAMIEFEKQLPPAQYIVSIKDKGPLKDDQKLCFWH